MKRILFLTLALVMASCAAMERNSKKEYVAYKVNLRSRFTAKEGVTEFLKRHQPTAVVFDKREPKPPPAPRPQPDLTVTAPLTMLHYAGNDYMHLKIRVSNIGDATAKPYMVRVEILKGMSPSSEVSCWWLLGPFTHTLNGETFGMHAQSFGEFDLPFPTPFMEEKDFIQRAVVVKIDPENDLTESKKDNNNFHYDKTGTNFPTASTFPVGIEIVGGEVANSNPPQ